MSMIIQDLGIAASQAGLHYPIYRAAAEGAGIPSRAKTVSTILLQSLILE